MHNFIFKVARHWCRKRKRKKYCWSGQVFIQEGIRWTEISGYSLKSIQWMYYRWIFSARIQSFVKIFISLRAWKKSQCCFPNCQHIERRPTAIQRKVIIDYYSEAFSVPLSVFCEPFHLPNVYKKVTVQRENIQRVGDRLMHMAIHWKESIEYHTGLCPTSLSDYLSYFVYLPKFSNLIGI